MMGEMVVAAFKSASHGPWPVHDFPEVADD
jgi:hypothetical protein